MKLTAHVDGQVFEFDMDSLRETVVARLGPASHAVVLDDQRTTVRGAFLDDRRVEFGWSRQDNVYTIVLDGLEYVVEVRDDRAELAAKFQKVAGEATGETVVKAPIPGLVRRIAVKPGDTVAKDQTLLTLDAMKLENEIPSPRDGVVKSVQVQPGLPVDKGQPLVVIG